MIGNIKAELYKILHSYYFYGALGLTILMHIIFDCFVSPKILFNVKLDYFSYIFLLITNLIIGSSIAKEYGNTMKETILAVQSRGAVIGSKIIVSILMITIVFGAYLVGLIPDKSPLMLNLVLNQYFAVMQHTFILILCAVLFRSFSSLSVGTVIFLIAYKKMGASSGNYWTEDMLQSTYYRQFTNIHYTHISAFSVLIVLISVGVAILLFSRQEI